MAESKRNEETKESHESYGMLGISRCSCSGPMSFFGSSISHRNFIEIKIHEADKIRNLNRDYYHHKKLLTSFRMSQTQFAEAITNMNTSGVPVTLVFSEGERKEECPDINYRTQLENEFKGDVQRIMGNLTQALKTAEKTLLGKGTLSAGKRKELASELYHIEQDIRANMPFVQKSFDEQIDKSVMEAKGEIDAFVGNMINTLGIEKLKEKIGLLDVNKDIPLLKNENDILVEKQYKEEK